MHAGRIKLFFLCTWRESRRYPAVCSEGGSSLANRGNGSNGGGAVCKRAKRAADTRKRWLAEVEKKVINIFYALRRHVCRDSKYDAHARVLDKLVEEDCVSCLGSSHLLIHPFLSHH